MPNVSPTQPIGKPEVLGPIQDMGNMVGVLRSGIMAGATPGKAMRASSRIAKARSPFINARLSM